jgi:hypothetical protein
MPIRAPKRTFFLEATWRFVAMSYTALNESSALLNSGVVVKAALECLSVWAAGFNIGLIFFSSTTYESVLTQFRLSGRWYLSETINITRPTLSEFIKPFN